VANDDDDDDDDADIEVQTLTSQAQATTEAPARSVSAPPLETPSMPKNPIASTRSSSAPPIQKRTPSSAPSSPSFLQALKEGKGALKKLSSSGLSPSPQKSAEDPMAARMKNAAAAEKARLERGQKNNENINDDEWK